jgi:hypothetical protein
MGEFFAASLRGKPELLLVVDNEYARAHEVRGLTAPDGRAGRVRRRARRLLLKARDDAAARLR